MTDPASHSIRATLHQAHRLVVKIGTRSLVGELGQEGRFAELAGQLAAQRAEHRSIVLVSSGAVALGWRRLGLKERPSSMARLQAAAAAGQSRLMQSYEDAFRAHGIHVAQILLTHSDLADRDRYLNARAALEALLELGAIPVINENDTVAIDEIRFGDNDQLAAMVATLVSADVLVLLTDVEGLLDEEGNRISIVDDAAKVAQLVRPTRSGLSLGGMASKLAAAQRATKRGVPVVIADARDPNVLRKVMGGDDAGTLFLPDGARLASRKHWIAYTLRPVGDIVVDDGAAEAITVRQRSLLPAGVVSVRGTFDVSDPVRIVRSDGTELARGLARYSSRDMALLVGAKTSEIEGRLGRRGGDEIVHRDDMVVTAG